MPILPLLDGSHGVLNMRVRLEVRVRINDLARRGQEAGDAVRGLAEGCRDGVYGFMDMQVPFALEIGATVQAEAAREAAYSAGVSRAWTSAGVQT